MADNNHQHRLPPWTIAIVLIISIVLIVLAAQNLQPGWNWIVTLILMSLVIVFLGFVMTGKAFGVLINSRNLMSLSRFQTTLWTILILSGYFAIVMLRLDSGHVSNALDVAIPWEVWSLLGISSAALVGSPLLSNDKRRMIPQNASKLDTKLAALFSLNKADLTSSREGILYANPDPKDACFTDMFEGDELKDTSLIDLAKLQMFFFTVIIAITYGAQLFDLIVNADLADDIILLPNVNSGLLALMGISNIAYLGNKRIQYTPSEE